MDEDHRKSFWTSMPGILTGVAAVIVAIGGIIATLHIGSPPPPPPSSTTPAVTSPPSHPSSVAPTTQTISSSNQIPDACGTKQMGINIFGKWKWIGTNTGATQSGITTFKNDCTYTNVATAGLTVNTNGKFNISSSPTTTINMKNNLGKEQNYVVNKIHNDSFHMNDLNNIINFDFIRTS